MGSVAVRSLGLDADVNSSSLREMWKEMKFQSARCPGLSDDYLMGFSHAMCVSGHISQSEFQHVCDWVRDRTQHRMRTGNGLHH